jgi:hypothetical protein
MMGWLNPGAWWALSLAVLPIVIHLLRTHSAPRLSFPSLRFVQPSRSAAVRMRLPSDVLLMLVRVAIVTLAVAAMAAPILLTAARTTAWDARTARAVIFDTSDSMRAADGAAAAAAVDVELRSASYATRIDAEDLSVGLARGLRWLAVIPPARREVVVISDLHRGAFREAAASAIPEGVGIRFVRVGRALDETSLSSAPLLGAGDVALREQTIELTRDATSAAIRPSAVRGREGLRFLAPPNGEAGIERLLRAIARAGTPSGERDQPIAVSFAGSPSPSAIAPIRENWMTGAVVRLLGDAERSTAALGTSRAQKAAAPWTAIGWNRDGSVLARAAAAGPPGNELLIDIAASPDSFEAAEIVRDTLIARLDPDAQAEHEIARIDEAQIAAWTRPAGPVAVTDAAWRSADSSDARWVWLGVLALLGVEHVLRSRAASRQEEGVHRAAA